MKSNDSSIFLILAIVALIIFSGSESIAVNNIINKKGDELKQNISDIVVKDMNNKDVKLSDYEGKVLLIVNVASKCGYTKQYKGLQEIYDKYKSQGFEILAFPCNQFGGQEPGSNEQIAEFCSANFGVAFKLFDKIDVNGSNRSPLYERLTNSPSIEKGDVKWNFEKFLIDKEGNIVRRFLTKVEPTSKEVISAIESELKK
jgi:glutathione peroxidase